MLEEERNSTVTCTEYILEKKKTNKPFVKGRKKKVRTTAVYSKCSQVYDLNYGAS